MSHGVFVGVDFVVVVAGSRRCGSCCRAAVLLTVLTVLTKPTRRDDAPTRAFRGRHAMTTGRQDDRTPPPPPHIHTSSGARIVVVVSWFCHSGNSDQRPALRRSCMTHTHTMWSAPGRSRLAEPWAWFARRSLASSGGGPKVATSMARKSR